MMKPMIFGIVLALAVPAGAASFSDTLNGATLNPALHLLTTDGSYAASPSISGLELTRTGGSDNGYVVIASTFTFSGSFTLSVDATGLRTGLSQGAEAGLAIASGFVSRRAEGKIA